MKKFKLLFTLILVLFLFSCEDEDDEKIIQKVEEEKDVDSLLTNDLKFSLYPEYTFWNSKFKITIEKNNKYDTTNFKFKFNNLEIFPSEIIVDSLLIDFIFFTPENSYSDSLEISYLSKDDTLSVFTKKYDVVNSEIKIDEIQNSVLCDNNFILKGKGLRYAKYLNVNRGLIKYASGGNYTFKGICETIDDNTAKFKINHQEGFNLKIVNIDSLRTDKFKYLKLVESDIVYDKFSIINIEDPKIKSSLLENNQVTLITSRWAKFKPNDKIYFDNKLITRSEISFYPAKLDLVEFTDLKNAYYYADVDGSVKFNIPNDSKSNDIRIEFECGGEIDLTPTIGNQYRSVRLITLNLKTEYDIKKTVPQDMTVYDFLTYDIDSMKSNISYPGSYVNIYKYSHDRGGTTDIKKLKIINLDKNNIEFSFQRDFSSSYSSNNGYYGSRNTFIEYSGNYTLTDFGNYIEITIDQSNINNLKISDKVKSTKVVNVVTLDIELESYEFINNGYLKLVLEKW